MTPSQIVSALRSLLAIRQPAFLWGPPGVGKSQVVAQVARQNGLALRDIRAVLLDPVDLRGLPRISADGGLSGARRPFALARLTLSGALSFW